MNTTISSTLSWLLGLLIFLLASPVAYAVGGFTISKAMTAVDNSSPSVSGNFNVAVNCAGAVGYPTTLVLSANGTPIVVTDLADGTVCTFSEDVLTLPVAPVGYTWIDAQISPQSITIQGNNTAVIATNTLAPLPESVNVLTITKTIAGTGSGSFAINIIGPKGYVNNTQINGGETLNIKVPAQGSYTVTEVTPSGWTTTYTAVPGTGGNSQAVVTLISENTATLATTPISGTVYQDFNSDGQMTNTPVVSDTGVSGVTVTVYGKTGGIAGNATTDANGNYTINPSGPGPYRVEFSSLPAGYEPTMHSFSAGLGANGTSVQFITTDAQTTGVNMGILDPQDYCQNNPDLATTVLTGEAFTDYASTVSLLTFKSGSVNEPAQPFLLGSAGSNQFKHPVAMDALNTAATHSQVGNLYGLAWHRETQALFSSAYGRSNNMTNGGVGPSGLGAIYLTKNGATSLFTTVANVGTFGNAMGNKVGTVGLGDLQVSEDGKTLYAVNVFAHTLEHIPINGTTPTAGTPTRVPLPVPADCPATNIHGFGLGQYRGKMYVALTCDGIGAANLIGYVYEYDGSTFTQKINLPFTYPRPNAKANYYGYLNYAEYQTNNLDFVDWGTYSDLSNSSTTGTNPSLVYIGAAINPKTQPWLADISFDKGDMLLGVRNRLGDARLYSYWVTGGDLLRACADSPTSPTAWTLENNGSCGGKSFTVPMTDPYTGRSLAPGFDSPTYGLGGRAYYWGNIGFEGKPSDGEFVQIPGYNVTYGTGTDIQSHNNQFGIMALSHVTGAITGGGHVDGSYDQAGPPWYDNGIGKGNGLGDIEVLCDPAPIEIGNRVWNDIDGDGVQDSDESGLNGVVVSLQGPNGTVTTTTSMDGNYTFGGLKANTDYTVMINSIPNGYKLTVPNAQALSGVSVSSNDAIRDTIDSDAVAINSIPTLYYTTGLAGQNNHGLDFGFTRPAIGQADILNQAPPQVDIELTKVIDKTSAKRGDIVAYTLTARNAGSDAATGVQVNDSLPAGVTLSVTTPPVASQGAYNAGTGVWDIGGISAGQAVTLTITVTVD